MLGPIIKRTKYRAGVLYFFIVKNLRDKAAILGLFVKLLSGILMGLIYKYYYAGGDTFQYYTEASLIVSFIKAHPNQLIDIIFNTLQIDELAGQLAYTDHPRALFFTKMIVPFFVLTGGNYWILGLILSLLNFLAVFVFITELAKSFPHLRSEMVLAFYFLPTFVFWTSGLLKESIAIAALLVLFGTGLKITRSGKFSIFPDLMILLFSGYLLWQLKYFYAAVAFPILATWLGHRFLSRYTEKSRYIIPVFLVLGVVSISLMHHNLEFGHVLGVVHDNYQTGIEKSEGRAIQYFGFDGSWLSFLINSPVALFSGLYRPMPFEISGFFPLLVSLENSVVLLLMAMALWKAGFRLTIKNSALLLLIIYIMILAVFIAFSTPNFGTLSRFKVGYWPFFVFLILSYNKKSQAKA